MKEMVKRIREEKGGFTLAELLIVVAILLVLIAIAVPLFTGALGRAEAAVDNANKRSATSEAKVDYQLGNKSGSITYVYYYDGNGNELPDSGPGASETAPSEAVYKYQLTISKVETGTDKGDIKIEYADGNGKITG